MAGTIEKCKKSRPVKGSVDALSWNEHGGCVLYCENRVRNNR